MIVRRGLTIRGAGAERSAIERRGTALTRLFVVMHPNAVLQDLTLRNGYWQRAGMAYGGAVWMRGGLIERCLITNNIAWGLPNQPGWGGGVFLEGGVVRNCVLAYNQALANNNSAAGGGGIYMTTGAVENCTVVSNHTARTDGTGASDGVRGGGNLHDRRRSDQYDRLFQLDPCSDALSGGSGLLGFPHQCPV